MEAIFLIKYKNLKHIHKKTTIYILIFTIAVASSILSSSKVMAVQSVDSDDVKKQIDTIYSKRCKAFITKDITPIKKYYDTSKKLSKWSLEHEIKRIKYLNAWADARGIQFKKVTSFVRIKKLSTYKELTKAFLEETYKFDYCYKCDPNKINSFGIGIRHVVKLMKTSKSNIIYNDWYTDCFEDSLEGITASVSTSPYYEHSNAKHDIIVYKNLKKTLFGPYKRVQAVTYADKYCGAAWGSKNNFKYNPKYRDFNFGGGDCTNFASQVLGDKEGGCMSFDGAWFCQYPKYRKASGTHAWVNADGLKGYLIYSGKGSTVIGGNFETIFNFFKNNKASLSQKIQLGDLVCYEKKGNVDHFAIITAFDSQGYPLVNSHTTDRYHVPWDLGWSNKSIKFNFIHINY